MARDWKVQETVPSAVGKDAGPVPSAAATVLTLLLLVWSGPTVFRGNVFPHREIYRSPRDKRSASRESTAISREKQPGTRDHQISSRGKRPPTRENTQKTRDKMILSRENTPKTPDKIILSGENVSLSGNITVHVAGLICCIPMG